MDKNNLIKLLQNRGFSANHGRVGGDKGVIVDISIDVLISEICARYVNQNLVKINRVDCSLANLGM